MVTGLQLLAEGNTTGCSLLQARVSAVPGLAASACSDGGKPRTRGGTAKPGATEGLLFLRPTSAQARYRCSSQRRVLRVTQRALVPRKPKPSRRRDEEPSPAEARSAGRAAAAPATASGGSPFRCQLCHSNQLFLLGYCTF